ncbi:MAG: T9SS type A sorting domain-containing protein [Bacteroidales bacterium]
MRLQSIIWTLLLAGGMSLAGQNVNIPDENFLEALIDAGVDSDGDSLISFQEAEAVHLLDLSQEGISDLTGIGGFVNLDTLICRHNGIAELDLSACISLQYLNCEFNNLDSLDLSENTALTSVNCSNNQLVSLDVSNCAQLGTLKCYLNNLTALDVSDNAALMDLECYNNSLSELDVTANHLLEELACVSNNLSELDISSNLLLRYLNCADNQLTVLDLSVNSELHFLHCEQNLLEELDLSGCPGLLALECQGNLFTELDVTGNESLTYLDCQNNRLTELDVSANGSLLFLGCGRNDLTGLDVTSNPALKTIDCSNNQLTCLDVSQNPVLTEIRCSNNQLTCLDLSENTLIERLNCSGNRIVSIDLTNFRGCDWFLCISLRDMPSLLQVCIADMSYSYLISLTGSPNAYFTTECKDIIPPVLSAPDTLYQEMFIQATSSEDGILYLVPGETEQDLPVIRQTALDSMEVMAGVPVDMPLEGLGNGTYRLYARDSSENVSDPHSFAILGVGVEKPDEGGVTIYPNPSKNSMTVETRGLGPIGLQITDLSGRIMQCDFSETDRYAFDLEPFPEGIYILRITSGQKTFTRRFVRVR